MCAKLCLQLARNSYHICICFHLFTKLRPTCISLQARLYYYWWFISSWRLIFYFINKGSLHEKKPEIVCFFTKGGVPPRGGKSQNPFWEASVSVKYFLRHRVWPAMYRPPSQLHFIAFLSYHFFKNVKLLVEI